MARHKKGMQIKGVSEKEHRAGKRNGKKARKHHRRGHRK